MSPSNSPVTHLVICSLLAGAVSARAELSAIGSWEFDEARRESYITSVRANQRGGAMPEIAAEMALAKVENTTITFGIDDRGPHVIRTDKTSGESIRKPITVRRDGQDLIVTEEEAGGVLRLQLVDKDHLTMVDEMHKLTIPLKRR